MEKIYTMTIRDLSNEAKELNTQVIEVKAFEEEVKKRVEVLAENHILAIASYLNHQLDEVSKITTNFHTECYYMEERVGVKIEKIGENINYLLLIKPLYYSKITRFIINDPKCSYHEKFSAICEKFPFHMETLIKNWPKLKKQLLYNIKIKIENIQKENEKKQKALQEKLALYENFEL